MAKSLLRSLLQVSLLLDTVKALEALQPSPATVKQLDLRANPEPTPRATLAEEGSNLLGRSYYNTLCGYANGDLNYPVTCGGGYICATANNYNAAGCCDPNGLAYCILPSTCISYGGFCDAVCQSNNIAYTSCDYLSPYCLTKVFEYDAPFYEYDCATSGGVLTIEISAHGLATQNVLTEVAVVTQTIATTASATVVADTGSNGGSITDINCSGGSSCGNGNGDTGNGNGFGNKSVASMRTVASSLRLLSLVCIVVFAWL